MNNYINIFDLILITIILFGPSLYSSFSARKSEVLDNNDVCEFSNEENIQMFIAQLIQLIIAILYLKFRGVDPFQFKFHITFIEFLKALILFSICGFGMDLITSLKYGFNWIPKLLKHNIPIISAIQDINLPLVLISFLNGFYEEFFFLIIWSYMEPKYSAIAIILMIIVRVMIHSYQGFSTALAIGVGLGLAHYLLFINFSDNLFIYVFAHILADLFGLSFINLI